MVQPEKPTTWSAVLSGQAALVMIFLGPRPRCEAGSATNPGRG